MTFVSLLLNPEKVISNTLDGLTQWATKIIPTLFPFMIMNSIMISSNIDTILVSLLAPFVKILFPYCSSNGIYAIIMGYLCGFPMGAKATSDLFAQNKISSDEANYLLSFCNNIGPSFFIGLIIPLLKDLNVTNIYPYIFGMYGIPLTYGIILGFYHKLKTKPSIQLENKVASSSECPKISSIIYDSCLTGIKSILVLGSYIAFISSLKTIPEILPLQCKHKSLIYIILEINSGIKAIYKTNEINSQWKIIIIMTALSFSGLSCFLQTESLLALEQNKLSFGKYIKHKIIISVISFLYYFIIVQTHA